MKVAYVEMIGGASGNMLLGALLDAGLARDDLERALRTLPLDGWSSTLERVVKRGVAATHYDFVVAPNEPVRRLADVLDVLARSALAENVRARASAIYRRLAEAEARVHGTNVDAIHFHEVGATDAILDIAGACVGFDLLGVERVACSAFPIGRGTIAMHHGRYPNPPPATLELLRDAPTYDAGIDGEMVTTTGAAVLTSFVERPGERPAMRASAIGYGAGRSDFAIPNVLRVSIGAAIAIDADRRGAFLGDARSRPSEALANPAVTTIASSPNEAERSSARDAANGASPPDGADVARRAFAIEADEVVVLEANVDDMSPQRFELAIERALAAGAHDVWLAPVTMKKSRPGILFGAVAPRAREADVAAAMLAETTTLGVRVRVERRYVLPRAIATIETPLGSVRVKTATIDGQARRTLEYDDVARIARERNLPFAETAARIEEYLPPHDLIRDP